MQHPDVLKLSERFSPPKIDLRRAKILDDYGDESFSPRPINHRVPSDVTQEDLEYYDRYWAFMKFEDLLFYLYPVAMANERLKQNNENYYDYNNEYLEFYLLTMHWLIAENLTLLEPRDRGALIEGLKWIWESEGPDADWDRFPGLKTTIGLGSWPPS